MRRLSAYFALFVIWAGILNPFLAAAQLSTVHACCRRSGTHHCQKYSGAPREAEFQAPNPNCPYAAPMPVAALTALEPARFSIFAPSLAGFVASARMDRAHAADLHHQSARGLPPSLL